jgi:hypothetical protein
VDPQEYADARWHALLRAAADLGVDEDDVPALVRRVLAAQRRRIRRAEDPDPLVHAALAEAVRGPGQRRRPPWRAMGGAGAAPAAVLVVVALIRPDEPPVDHLDDDQVPSLFGFGRADAEDLLRGLGLEVSVKPMRACEVADRVIGSDPQRGTSYERGDRITVYTAVPASITCLTTYQQRSTVWQLIDLANGRGHGPPFADRILVSADDGPATELDHPADRDAWAATGVLDTLRKVTTTVRLTDDNPLTYAGPALRILSATEARGDCAVPEPRFAGRFDVFTAAIATPTGSGCPLRLAVYRAVGRVTAVALYAGSS